jgi:type II secretory pathway component PulC
VNNNAAGPAAEKAGPVQRPEPATAEEDRRKAAGTGGGSPSMESLPDAAGLSLQAISWSEQPARRIAVINARILKEGEKIEEYTVLEINRDDVVFQHQGQLWKLAFREK